ncbi:MAG: metal-dependent hydrolase, partial [Marinomonas sp.]
MNMLKPVTAQPDTIDTPTPAGHEITPRDRRFGREEGQELGKYWQNGDAIATAFYNCLSLTFPRGEAFFI